MAKRNIITDDLEDGQVEATHEGVVLTFENTSVTLDLGDANYDELVEVLEPYLSAGTEVKQSKRRADAPQVRLWALQQPEFADGAKGRGRLPNAVYEAYDAAQSAA